MTNPLTHFNEEGRAKMVDLTDKTVTERIATAQGMVYMQPETLRLIEEGQIKKGDVLAVAQVAGIMGAKKTSDVIPMCHPLSLTGVDISFEQNFDADPKSGLCSIKVTATAKVTGKTGVEMEALTAVSIAALTIYDMCKAVDKGMFFNQIGLTYKAGGKTGTFSQEIGGA
jgi:cyclic pyranopterin phosphate synthase